MNILSAIKMHFVQFFYFAHRTSLWPFGNFWKPVNSVFENLLYLSLSLSLPAHLLCSLIRFLSFSDFVLRPQGPPSISPALSAPNWAGQGASDVTYTQIINWLTKRFPLTSCPACEAPLHALVPHVNGPPCQRDGFLCLFVWTHAPVSYAGHCRTWISYFLAGHSPVQMRTKETNGSGRGPGSLLIGVRSVFSLFFCSLVASAWHTCCDGTKQPQPENPPTM